jgi:hypothetical protein
MVKPEFWWWSAARAEIDQRAREARLRLEHLERLLISRVLPTQSGPSQVLHQRGLRFFRGGCVQTRSTKVAPPGPRYGQPRPIPTDFCIAVNRSTGIGSTGGPRSPA